MSNKNLTIGLSIIIFISQLTNAHNIARSIPHPFILVSIPKAGTHLLQRCIQLITNYNLDNKHFRLPFQQLNYPNEKQLKTMLVSIKRNHYGSFHLRYNPTYALLLAQLNMRILFIYRDPRDQLVSRTTYCKTRGYRDFKYHALPFEALLRSFIGEVDQEFIGIKSFNHAKPADPKHLCNIQHLYQEFMPWAAEPACYTTTFEKLVGSRGGGSDQVQHQEIKNIAQHIGIILDDTQIQHIAQQLFGNTTTFVKGQIGSWKKHFLPEHKKAFKVVAPTLLQNLLYETDNQW